MNFCPRPSVPVWVDSVNSNDIEIRLIVDIVLINIDKEDDLVHDDGKTGGDI